MTIITAQNQTELREYPFPATDCHAINNLVFSPDNQTLALVCRDKAGVGRVLLWDFAAGQFMATLPDPCRRSVVFTPDGQMVITADEELLRVYEVGSGEIRREIPDAALDDLPMVMHPSNPWVATGWRNHTVSIWDIQAQKRLERLRHDFQPEQVVFTSDGRYLLVRGRYGDGSTISCWETSRWQLVNRFEFRDTLWSLTIHPHKNWIVAAFFQNQGKGLLRNYVQSYALNKKEQLEPVYEPAWYANSVTEMAFNPGGSLLAAITSDSQVHLVNGEGMKSASSWEEIFVRGLSFSPDGTWLATYANFPLGGSKITLLSLRHPPSVTPTITHDSALEYVGAFENPRTVTSIAFSPDSTQLVSGGEDGAARIWDLESRHEVQRLPTINAIVAVDHAPKGSGIAALDIQNTLHIWASAPLHVKLSARAGISFSPDGRAIGAGAAVISAQKGQTLFYLGSHQAPVNEGVFSPDGRFYALGVGGDAGSDNHAKIYDLHTRELVIQLPHTSWVQQVEFSPDGDLLATVADGLNLWDWRTGTVIHTRYDVIRTAFSSDGHVLAIMLKSGKIRFLEVHDPASERGLGGYEGARRTMGLPPDRILRFSPDGQWFTVVEGARIHLWRIHQTIL